MNDVTKHDRCAEVLLVLGVSAICAILGSMAGPSELDRLRDMQKTCASQGKTLVRDSNGQYSCNGGTV